MYIGLIDWPLVNKDKRKLFLDYQIKIFDKLNINFNGYEKNPIEVAKLYIEDKVSNEAYNKNVDYWWEIIDKANAIRNFSDKDILMARVALCILIKDDFLLQIGENLSWFLELINFLGYDLDLPIEIMRNHFPFNKPSSIT